MLGGELADLIRFQSPPGQGILHGKPLSHVDIPCSLDTEHRLYSALCHQNLNLQPRSLLTNVLPNLSMRTEGSAIRNNSADVYSCPKLSKIALGLRNPWNYDVCVYIQLPMTTCRSPRVLDRLWTPVSCMRPHKDAPRSLLPLRPNAFEDIALMRSSRKQADPEGGMWSWLLPVGVGPSLNLYSAQLLPTGLKDFHLPGFVHVFQRIHTLYIDTHVYCFCVCMRVTDVIHVCGV